MKLPAPQWLAYTQLLDSALPVGAFAHSFGLETAAQLGTVRTTEDVASWVRGMLRHVWAPTDALAVKAVYEFGPAGDWRRVWEVDEWQHVSRAAMETRDGVMKMGRRLYKLARAMHPALPWGPLERAVREGLCPGTHPTVHGYVAFHLGIPIGQAAEGYLYGCASAAVNASLRLLSIGQTDAQALLAELLRDVAGAWASVAELPPGRFHANAPAAELYMMRHETLYSRLFMS
ncbi:urease accessory protein UreF [Paenibacillus alkalitolerans]|uniref:urease accessory protein UreF n=1 Tax=Paenibacillus alkalitolerans TaxID=2799335 RepID=UPI0018F7815A|nr:urease accessory protein UreF [Paenibacillus alkalitolerans]